MQYSEGQPSKEKREKDHLIAGYSCCVSDLSLYEPNLFFLSLNIQQYYNEFTRKKKNNGNVFFEQFHNVKFNFAFLCCAFLQQVLILYILLLCELVGKGSRSLTRRWWTLKEKSRN